jgi:hypothetical protein
VPPPVMLSLTRKLPPGVTVTLLSTGRPLNSMMTGLHPVAQNPVPVITAGVPGGPDGGLTETRGIGVAADAAPLPPAAPAKAASASPTASRVVDHLMATDVRRCRSGGSSTLALFLAGPT